MLHVILCVQWIGNGLSPVLHVILCVHGIGNGLSPVLHVILCVHEIGNGLSPVHRRDYVVLSVFVAFPRCRWFYRNIIKFDLASGTMSLQEPGIFAGAHDVEYVIKSQVPARGIVLLLCSVYCAASACMLYNVL